MEKYQPTDSEISTAEEYLDDSDLLNNTKSGDTTRYRELSEARATAYEAGKEAGVVTGEMNVLKPEISDDQRLALVKVLESFEGRKVAKFEFENKCFHAVFPNGTGKIPAEIAHEAVNALVNELSIEISGQPLESDNVAGVKKVRFRLTK